MKKFKFILLHFICICNFLLLSLQSVSQEIKFPNSVEAFYGRVIDSRTFTQQPAFVSYTFKSRNKAIKFIQKIIDAYSDVKCRADTFNFEGDYVILFRENIQHMPNCKIGFAVDCIDLIVDGVKEYNVVLYWIVYRDEKKKNK